MCTRLSRGDKGPLLWRRKSGLTCDAADLWETHHDLREAFGLVGELVLGVVLAHVPVTLVQLLQLGHVGQSSNIWAEGQ